MKFTRRQLLKAVAALPIPAAVMAAQGLPTIANAEALLDPTPETPDDADDPTPPADEGPFYKLKSPKRSNLIDAGMKGEKVTVSGRVVDRKGSPVPNALVDVWHADSDGNYDNEGYRCRGHLFTNSEGKYRFEAVFPGLYPGRTRHYHVRVQAPNKPYLTTQLFFPEEPLNEKDGIFKRELLMKVVKEKGKRVAGFDFVLNV